MQWLDGAGRFFNPQPRISVVPIDGEHVCIVIDDALARPEALVEWAASQSFDTPGWFAYPGLVLDAPREVTQLIGDNFASRARSRLNARRTLEQFTRLSLVTTPPEALSPVQWQCHQDRLATEPERVVYAAMLLYLFHDPAQGGTSFYRARQEAEQTQRMLTESKALSAGEFTARYGLRAGYLNGSNAYFERIAQVRAAWNRMIYYDGGIFHSADISQPKLLSADPRRGRLTLNGFFTCMRSRRVASH